MTAKKTASKKAPAKKTQSAKKSDDVIESQTVTEAASPEMEGEEYQVGYVGNRVDDEDYSMAAQVAKVSEG